MGALLTEAEHDRISRAIKAAEGRTSGEIYAVITRQSDDYFFVAGFFAAIWVLVASILGLVAARWLGWTIPALWLLAVQVTALGLILALQRFLDGLRMLFVPEALRRRRAHANGVSQFLAHGVHQTRHRTGVLIFVSLAERHAQIVADQAIDEQVSEDVWTSIIANLTGRIGKGAIAEGFVEAILACGGHLAVHFPRRADDFNELDDRLIEI